MGLTGRNFQHMVVPGLSIPPQVITDSVVNGATILEPWKTGRQLSFFLASGAWAATASGTAKLQQRLRSDGATWSDVVEGGSSGADLEFPQADLDDGGAGEGATLLGTIDLSSFDGDMYDAIRIVFEAETAAIAMPTCVIHVISDLYTHPSGTTDKLWEAQRYGVQ